VVACKKHYDVIAGGRYGCGQGGREGQACGVEVVILTQQWPFSNGRVEVSDSPLKKLEKMEYLVHSWALFPQNQSSQPIFCP